MVTQLINEKMNKYKYPDTVFDIPAIKLGNTVKGEPLTYKIDSENMVILPIFGLMLNRAFDNVSVDATVTQPPKRTFDIMNRILQVYEDNYSYFMNMKHGTWVPVAYVYDTKSRKEAMLVARTNVRLFYTNAKRNEAARLTPRIGIGDDGTITFKEGDTSVSNATFQMLLKRLPVKIEKYNLLGSPTVKVDFDALAKLL